MRDRLQASHTDLRTPKHLGIFRSQVYTNTEKEVCCKCRGRTIQDRAPCGTLTEARQAAGNRRHADGGALPRQRHRRIPVRVRPAFMSREKGKPLEGETFSARSSRPPLPGPANLSTGPVRFLPRRGFARFSLAAGTLSFHINTWIRPVHCRFTLAFTCMLCGSAGPASSETLASLSPPGRTQDSLDTQHQKLPSSMG